MHDYDKYCNESLQFALSKQDCLTPFENKFETTRNLGRTFLEIQYAAVFLV